jgi:hypothetical protein
MLLVIQTDAENGVRDKGGEHLSDIHLFLGSGPKVQDATPFPDRCCFEIIIWLPIENAVFGISESYQAVPR